MDYSKLSDTQLQALHTGDYSKLSNDELVGLHQASAPAPEMGMGEYIGRGVTGALPVVAGAAGGMAGAAAGPLGAVAGGGFGYAGGKELERLANHYAFGDELAPEGAVDAAKRVGTNVAEGGAAEAGGQVLGKAAEAAAPYVNPVSEFIGNKLASVAQTIPDAVEKTVPIVGGFLGHATHIPGGEVAGYSLGKAAAKPAAGLARSAVEGVFGKAAEEEAAAAPAAAQAAEKAEPAAEETPRDWFFKTRKNRDPLPPRPTPAPPEEDRPRDWFFKAPATKSASEASATPTAPASAQEQPAAVDKVSKLLTTSPEVLGEYAPVLRSAQARGSTAFATTNFLLQQSDPGFQEVMRKVASDPERKE
jgi:hypothetical protein